jgi:type I restriction enzyme S subunit
MKRYKKYKPSGIEWVGEIPEHWEEKKIKYFANLTLGKMLTSEDKGGYFLKPYLRAQNINWFKVDITDLKEMWFSQKELEKYRLSLNDILVSEGGEVGRTCIWQNEIDECYIQNSVHKISFKRNYNPRFFLYLFYYLGQKGYFASIVNQISIGHLTGEKLKEIFLIYPSADEQTYISNYLDRRAAQIDDLIAKKQKLIDLLDEEKTAIINQAVTKGLIPDAPMRDSDIPWLGEIPEHWAFKKLKYVAVIKPSNVDKKSYDGEKKVLLCNYLDVYKHEFIDNSFSFMEATANENEITKFTIKKGDVLVTKDSETPDDIANPAYIKEDLENVICGYHLAQIRANNIELIGEYLFRLFQTRGLNSHFEISANGITRFGLSVDSFQQVFVPLPPIKEQSDIIRHIQTEIQKIDATISKVEKEIELLQEFRTALISEAVTGKIDVRI